MKIRFTLPKGSEGWNKDIEMDYVPREGETVNFSADDDGHDYTIHGVHHYPDDPDFDVYIVVRD